MSGGIYEPSFVKQTEGGRICRLFFYGSIATLITPSRRFSNNS